MASPEQIASALPDTLPDDFGEWDGERSVVAAPVISSAREETGVLGEYPKPLGPADDRDAIVASVMNRTRDGRSIPTSQVFAKKHSEFINWKPESSAPESQSGSVDTDARAKSANLSEPIVDRNSSHDQQTEKISESPAVSSTAADSQWDGVYVRSKTPKADVQAVQQVVKDATKKTSDVASAGSADASIRQTGTGGASVAAAQVRADSAAVVDVKRTPDSIANSRREADEILFQSFQAKAETAAEPKSTENKLSLVAKLQQFAKEKPLIVGAGALLLLIVLMIPLFHSHDKTVAATVPVSRQTAPLAPIQPAPQMETAEPNTSLQKPLASGTPLTGAGAQPAADNEPVQQEQQSKTVQVKSTMMDDQLSAPVRINRQMADNAPPPENIAPLSADALGGSNTGANVFNSQGRPQVKEAPQKPLVISAGVATGMLVQKTAPTYPMIAKSARVSGTVVMQATIAKDGSIKDLHVVNGPAMLRQAAVDAVKTWRYKPYKLNNEPTEVETTINVNFSLGN
jgi:protein TonB